MYNTELSLPAAKMKSVRICFEYGIIILGILSALSIVVRPKQYVGDQFYSASVRSFWHSLYILLNNVQTLGNHFFRKRKRAF